MYTYAQVEALILDANGLEPYWQAINADIKASNEPHSLTIERVISSRIKNFQRIGISPSKPGRGQKLSYRLEDIIKWMICLEYTEFGIDPQYVKFIIDKIWPKIENHLKADRLENSEDWIIAFEPTFLSKFNIGLASFGGTGGPMEMEVGVIVPLSSYRPFQEGTECGRTRRALINLSAMRRDLEGAVHRLFGR